MIKRKGDVFTTETPYIGHGVNCKGVMGAGIAKTVKTRFPEVYTEYLDYVVENGADALSHSQAVATANGPEFRVIYNLFTQNHPGPDARYDAIFTACLDAAQDVKKKADLDSRSPVLALPMIGCGIGGLDWEKVEALLVAIEILVPGFQFEVWKYE